MELNPEEIINNATIENIDFAFVEFIKSMNLFATTNKGFNKVPVFWYSSDKSFLIKNDEFLRDQDGSLLFPIITIKRDSIQKDVSSKAVFQGLANDFRSNKGGYIPITKILKQDKTKNFANNDSKKIISGIVGNGQETYPRKNEKIVYETIFVPVPQHIEVFYEVNIETEYQQTMNELVQPFLAFSGAIKSQNIRANGHKYEAFMEEISDDSLDELEKQKQFKTTINFRIVAYIMGSGNNEDRPKTIRRENAVEVKIPRETVMVGDIPETNPKSKYRD